jgi:hypothetical protein
MGLLDRAAKALDRMTGSAGPRMALNRRIERYGEVTELRIDGERRTIEAELRLRGEREPVRVRVGAYELGRDERGDFLVVREVAVSREWMQALARDHLEGVPLRLPAEAAKVLRLLL